MDSETGSSSMFEGVSEGGSVCGCVTALTIERLDRLYRNLSPGFWC